MESKHCTICKKERKLSEFAKHKLTKDGLHHDCRFCAAEYRRRNREKRSAYDKQFHKDRPEVRKAWVEKNIDRVRELKREGQKRYWKKHKEKIQQKHKEKLQNDPKYKLKRRFYHFIKDSFRRQGFPKKGENKEIIGCDYEFFIQYIESQFKDGMNWENIEIDHIYPLNRAKDSEEVKRLCHYTNLQPMFGPDNSSKKDKLITKQLRLI